MRANHTARRIIPCLDVKDGRVVKGVRFVELRDIGDPAELAAAYDAAGADELVMLDISATQTGHDLMLDVIAAVAARIDIPLTVGGGLRSVEDIARVLEAGASKVSLNSAVIRDPELINAAAGRFGSERICIAIDTVLDSESGEWRCVTRGGTKVSGRQVLDWAAECAVRGAGSLLITSKDHDGVQQGFDLENLQAVCEEVSLPVIASGGAGKAEDFVALFRETDVAAGLAASVFHDGKVSIGAVKDLCKVEGIHVNE